MSPSHWERVVLSKKKILIRIDPELHENLRKWAEDEFRSVNGQIEFLLNNALKGKNRVKKNK
jgi:hypothetical protein